jgi:hypothetical protein
MLAQLGRVPTSRCERILAVQAIEATSGDPKGNMLGFGPINGISKQDR